MPTIVAVIGHDVVGRIIGHHVVGRIVAVGLRHHIGRHHGRSTTVVAPAVVASTRLHLKAAQELFLLSNVFHNLLLKSLVGLFLLLQHGNLVPAAAAVVASGPRIPRLVFRNRPQPGRHTVRVVASGIIIRSIRIVIAVPQTIHLLTHLRIKR